MTNTNGNGIKSVIMIYRGYAIAPCGMRVTISLNSLFIRFANSFTEAKAIIDTLNETEN